MSAAAPAVLIAAREAGLSLAAEPGGLRVRPTPSPELLERLRARKAELLLELLAGARCRHCGAHLDYRRDWDTLAFADGTGAHGSCRLRAAAERAVLSPDALADEAELMLRGEPPP